MGLYGVACTCRAQGVPLGGHAFVLHELDTPTDKDGAVEKKSHQRVVRNVLVSSAHRHHLYTLSARTASPICSTTSFVRAARRMCNPLSSGSIQASAPRRSWRSSRCCRSGGGGSPAARAPTTRKNGAAPAAARGASRISASCGILGRCSTRAAVFC
jgi:hypothetical protein